MTARIPCSATDPLTLRRSWSLMVSVHGRPGSRVRKPQEPRYLRSSDGRRTPHRSSRRSRPARVLTCVLVVITVVVSACTSGPTTQPAAVSQPATADPRSAEADSTPPRIVDGGQPSFPIRAAFYYQWFPEGWRQGGVFPFTAYTPSLGLYDSGAAATIKSHIESMRFGNIAAAIVSWWGPNEKAEQSRVPALLAGAGEADPAFRIALYYEKEGTADPSVAELKDDLDYISARYTSQENYLLVGGRPVLFVYNADDTDCTVVDRWKAADAAHHFYLDLKVFPGWSSCPAQPDGWHQYGPAESRSEITTGSAADGSFTISPGFSRAHNAGTTQPQLDRDPGRWSQDIRAMKASQQNWQLITSFNEWGEGTAVESATQWATASGQGAYLDALHADG